VRWSLLAATLRPVNVYNMAGFEAGQLAAEAQEQRPEGP
jgi:hypothetical protein